MEVERRKFTVMGGGVSGLAVSRLLKKHNADVFLTEKDSSEKKRKELESLSDAGIDWEAGSHTLDRIISADAIILSPGIVPSLPILLASVQRNIPIYSEIEAAYWFCKAPIIAVTGTNGKTTVTTYLGEILRNHGKNVEVAGNIGTPFSAVVDKSPAPELFVLELSSYQLERISSFHAHISIMLNISPDHLERYRNLDEYVQTKFRITLNQTPEDFFIYNADDPEIVMLAKNVKAKCITCSRHEIPGDGIWFEKDQMCFRFKETKEQLVSRSQIAVPGEHNRYNIMACAAAARLEGVSQKIIESTVQQFHGIEHRIEPVISLRGRSFYNDSKGTNVNAAFAALNAVKAPIILIAGGKDKNSDLSPLNELIQSKVKCLILLGEAADRMESAWRIAAPEIARVGSMESAVMEAYNKSQEGDSILLSPACSSFDMFENFKERGKVFKNAVMELTKHEENIANET